MISREVFRSSDAIAREEPERPLQKRTDREAGGNVAGPMREQNHAGQYQSRSHAPDEIALSGRQRAGCGGQCADMHGMARRKRIKPIARKRRPMQMTSDGSAIRSFLIKYRLQNMRQGGGGQRDQQDVVACAPCIRVLPAAV